MANTDKSTDKIKQIYLDYVIVSNNTSDGLAKEILEYIRQGYELVGDLHIVKLQDTTWFYRELVLPLDNVQDEDEGLSFRGQNKSIFTSGERVYNNRNGKGTITKIEASGTYPVKVSFDDGSKGSYSVIGKESITDANPSIRRIN